MFLRMRPKLGVATTYHPAVIPSTRAPRLSQSRLLTHRARFHAESKLVTIRIHHVKVAHPIVVVLRWLNHFCSASDEFGVKGIYIFHKNADAAIAREPLGFVGSD